MKQKIKPVMFLGLGKYGSEIAKGVYACLLAEGYSDSSSIVSCVTLEESGEIRDVEKNQSLFKYEGLKSELSVDNFQSNFQIIQEHEKEIEAIIADKTTTLRKNESLSALHDKGYDLAEKIELVIISTLFDTIGSAAIIPFLGFIQCLFAGRLSGMLMETSILGFFSDLFEEYKNEELAYCRTYACLQELDFIGDNPRAISSCGLIPFSFIHLFTGKNEDAIEISSYKELIPMIGQVLCSLFKGEVASDVNFSTSLLNKKEGKTTRYNSFGLNKLVFPIKNIMKGLSDYLGFSLLGSKNAPVSNTFEMELINADVKEFLLKNKFDTNYKLSNELYQDNDGAMIWHDFKYNGAINEDTVVGTFINNIEEQARDFDKDALTHMNRKLSLKREKFFTEKQESLLEVVRASMDSKKKGIYYSKAFLDVLLNQQSLYITGSIVEQEFSFEQIERVIKNFFDETMGAKKETLLELKQDIQDKLSCVKKLKEDNTAIKKSDEAKKETPVKTEAKDDAKCEDKLQADKSPEDKINDLETEINDLKKIYLELKKEIDDFDIRITDPSKRRKLLYGIVEEFKKEIEANKPKLHTTDAEYRSEKSKLKELYDKQKKNIVKLFLILCGATVGFIIVCAYLKLSFQLSILVYILCSVGYGAWGFLGSIKKIKAEITKTLSKVSSLKSKKINFLLKCQGLHNNIFRTRFEYSLHGSLLDRFIAYKKFTKDIDAGIENFINNLTKSANEKREAFENIMFPNSLFARSVVTKDDLNRFIKDNLRLSVELERFLKENTLSNFFDEFKKTGNLDSLFAAIDCFAGDVFRSVSEESIEGYLKKANENGRMNVIEKMVDFYNAAKAHIFLEVEKGLDGSLPLTYLGVEEPERSYTKDIFNKQGCTYTRVHSIKNKHEIVLYKVKVGFPAFHIALIKYGNRLISQFAQKDSLYVNPEYAVEDLLPAFNSSANNIDEEMQMVSLGRAFGLVEKKEEGLYFNEKKLGESYQATVDLLKSFKGITIRNQLSEQIETEKQKEGAIDRLSSYIDAKNLDINDKAIIEQSLTELNPLA